MHKYLCDELWVELTANKVHERQNGIQLFEDCGAHRRRYFGWVINRWKELA